MQQLHTPGWPQPEQSCLRKRRICGRCGDHACAASLGRRRCTPRLEKVAYRLDGHPLRLHARQVQPVLMHRAQVALAEAIARVGVQGVRLQRVLRSHHCMCEDFKSA